MSSQELTLSYITEQLDSLATRPEMWGPTLCVELQFRLLLEFWLVTVSPKLAQKRPRLVHDEYHAFRKRQGLDTKRPLAETNEPIDEFKRLLQAFRADFLKRVAPSILADLEEEVRERFPLATTGVAPPLVGTPLQLSTRMGDRLIAVEWDPTLGFCVSRVPAPAHAERSHVLDSQQALQRICVLLRCVSRTATVTASERWWIMIDPKKRTCRISDSPRVVAWQETASVNVGYMGCERCNVESPTPPDDVLVEFAKYGGHQRTLWPGSKSDQWVPSGWSTEFGHMLCPSCTQAVRSALEAPLR